LVSKAGAEVKHDAGDLFPEATVVVPASYGGIAAGNWDPEATAPVTDLGDLAQLLHRRKPVLRLVPDVLCPGVNPVHAEIRVEVATSGAYAVPAELAREVPTVRSNDPEFDARAALREWLEKARTKGNERWQLVIDALLGDKRGPRLVELGAGFYAVLGRRLTRERMEQHHAMESVSDIVGDDDDGASYIGAEITLDAHLKDVERWIRAFGANVGLPNALVDDLALSARLHDIGKSDPRFQRMLHGGSAVRMAASDQLLAKSRGDSGDREARRQAQVRAGYPNGYRHELLSVAMVQGNATALSEAYDPELVLHLIGSHHGWCRPFAPAVDHGPSLAVGFEFDGQHYQGDAAHGFARADSGIADRFWRLTERYGWWQLAWFESLVRLADHRASEERSEANGGALD
jgi:CRISPR-associated endonuclease/helicase Cas3